MANLSNEEKAFMNSLFNSYDLSMDDIFRHQHFVIIKRQGIEKIMAKANLDLAVDQAALPGRWGQFGFEDLLFPMAV